MAGVFGEMIVISVVALTLTFAVAVGKARVRSTRSRPGDRPTTTRSGPSQSSRSTGSNPSARQISQMFWFLSKRHRGYLD